VDSGTQSVLDSIVESMPASRIFLLGSCRPEYVHRWGGKTYYSTVRLDAVIPSRADELLSVLVGEDASPQSLKRLLIQRTEGNPFFLEESVRTLVEAKALTGVQGSRLTRPLDVVQVPATVQAVLGA